METLQAKTRDMSIKAKKLRREGYLTGSISGREIPESISIAIPQNKAAQFMKKHSIGSRAIVNVDGTEYKTIIKGVDYDALNHQYIDMTFQQLIADEKIHATAEIFFVNEDKAKGFLTHALNKIDYKAYPADLVDKIEIDVSKYPIGTHLAVADLDIAKNDKVDIVTPLDSSVLHVLDHQHMSAEDEAMIEEAEAAAAGTDEA
jgi:large subunit ribosomal protein L25